MDPLWHMYLEFLDPGQQALVFTDNEYKRRQAIYMGCSRELDGVIARQSQPYLQLC